MKLDRKELKSRIAIAVQQAFAERNTVNVIIAKGLAEMVDAMCDQLDTHEPKAKKAA